MLVEVFDCIEGTDNTVLMKSIAPVSTTEVGSVYAVNFLLALLSQHTFGGKHRMVVAHTLDNARFIDRVIIVQSDTELVRRIQTLQDIHVVG